MHHAMCWPRTTTSRLAHMATFASQVDMPLIVGEWSLATDNCAMWLNGFNDNLPGFPKASIPMLDFKPCWT
eukprot:scaffold182561_cov36-Tisochrysis_lutea.AAC.5